jgi:DHA3 family macrolide efflux protein-like MFS transporter
LEDIVLDENQSFPLPEDAASQDWKRKAVVFLSSQSLSMFGSMLVQYAIIWYITLETQSGAVLTIATLASFLPQIVISLFAGVWADRYSRKLLIIGSDALTAASTLALAILFLLGYRELWLLYLVSAIRSVGGGIQAPAVSAMLPQLVPADRLLKVNSINGTIQPFIMIAAPMAAGALLSFSRLEAIFFVDVVTAALAIGLLAALYVPPYRQTRTEPASYLGDLKTGLSYIGQSRTIKTLFVFFATAFFLMTPVIFLTPLLVARSFGDEVWRLTANEVTFFVGSILGGLLMTAWGGFKNPFRTIGLACLLWAVLFVALGLSRVFPLYLFFMFLSGIPMPLLNISTTTLLQEMVPADLQGRVFSVMMLINTTVMPLGMLVFGPIADRITIEILLVLSSAALAIPSLWVFFRQQPQADLPGPAADYEAQPGD